MRLDFILLQYHSTHFGCRPHPSSGVHKTVVTATCTVWRKKKACFSSNCNFVYFQYKKIILTPKQPVINTVLITYIDYSITEN